MAAINFEHDLQNAMKKYEKMERLRRYYERGIITFEECLKTMAKVLHEERLQEIKETKKSKTYKTAF